MLPQSANIISAARTLTLTAMFLVVVAVLTGGMLASAAHAAEVSTARSRAIAVHAVAHRVGIGAAAVDPGADRKAVALQIARDELANADAVMVSSAGKAGADVRTALQAARDGLARAMAADAGGVIDLRLVFALREAEKTTTTAVAAWEAAEAARIAAEAAARAAAEQAAAAAAAAAADDSWVSRSSSSSAASAPAPQASGPVADCGPCPGATLVPVTYEGVTYWGCP